MRSISATPLELCVDAAVATLAAWTYPSDTEIRRAAVVACHSLNVDYIAAVAAQMDLDVELSADEARYKVAQGFLRGIENMRASGLAPRPNTLASGRAANGLGLEEQEGSDEQFN